MIVKIIKLRKISKIVRAKIVLF